MAVKSAADAGQERSFFDLCAGTGESEIAQTRAFERE